MLNTELGALVDRVLGERMPKHTYVLMRFGEYTPIAQTHVEMTETDALNLNSAFRRVGVKLRWKRSNHND